MIMAHPLIEKIQALQHNYSQRTGVNMQESLKNQSLSNFFLKKSELQKRAKQIRFLENTTQFTQKYALFDKETALAIIIAAIDFIQNQISTPKSCLAQLLEEALLTVTQKNTKLSLEECVKQAQQFIQNNMDDISKASRQYGLHPHEWHQFMQHMDSLTTQKLA